MTVFPIAMAIPPSTMRIIGADHDRSGSVSIGTVRTAVPIVITVATRTASLCSFGGRKSRERSARGDSQE
jgi:hypothetical protein